jgi:VWFA-related protein
MVLVNVIVTDKQGNYLRDMKQKDFHVFEDGKEQTITSFSREADVQPGSAVDQREGSGHEAGIEIKPIVPVRPRYMVIFFDCVFMRPESQMYERDQAVRFVESTASTNRLMAVMNFDGDLHLNQDFTANGDLLKTAIEKPKFSPYDSASESTKIVSHLQGDIAFRSEMRAIRNIAKVLGRAPGRKTMLYLSNGIATTPEHMADFQDTINALNQANVGVYTFGARGLEGPGLANAAIGPVSPGFGRAVVGFAPRTPPGLRELAAQTGGFAYINKNDLQMGMEKASEEIDEYYILGYVPPNPAHDGSYHKIRVKLDRRDVEVRAREGYTDTKSPNLLAGKPEGRLLESRAASTEAGEIPVSLTTPYFYVRPGVARINLTVSIPVASIDFKKHNDDFHSQVDVLGIATRADGSVAARFSDAVSVDYKKDAKPAKDSPFYYENSFKIAPGEYTFKLVLSAGGDSFGKYVVPLAVVPFTGEEFSLSGPAFGDALAPYPMDSAELDPMLIEGSVPMVANNMQVVPSSSNHFKKGKQPVVYMEVYDPLLAGSHPDEEFLYNIVNRKNNQKVYSPPPIPINQNVHPGKPRVPVIFNLFIDRLPPGDYRIEIQARDSAHNFSPVRTGDFSIE